MKHPLILALAAATAAVAMPAAASAAPGEVLDVIFAGTVASTVGATGYTVGGSVTGEFVYSGTIGGYDFFAIGGQSAPAGFASSASVTPSLSDAIYQAQVSAVQQGGSVNATFALDLSALTSWPSSDAIALLTNTSQLTTNLDTVTFPSTFTYSTAAADGTGIVSLTADLTSLNVTVPEPASLLLLATSLLGLAATRRRA